MTCLELKIPPLFVVLVFGSAMWLLAHASPSYQFNLSHPHIVGLALAVAGLLISAAGFFAFRAARTTSNPMKPATSSALVVSGIYKITRNPMYLGFLLLVIAWALFLSNMLALAFIPAFVIYMNRFQIRPEERALTKLFGQDFIDYKARVRRWF